MRYVRVDNGVAVEEGDFTSIVGRFHPSLLWIASDAPLGYLWDGKQFSAPPVPPVDPAKLAADCSAAIQHLLDSTAQAHGYDDLERAITYIGDAVAKWDAEGARAKAWRSDCWSAAKVIQDAAAAGNWPTTGAAQLPTVADVLAAMPAAAWPA